MDLKNFASAIAQIAEEKGIPKDQVIEIIETAIAAAYKKDYGEKGQIIKAKLDSESGQVKFWQIKLVVDEKTIYSEEELEKLKEDRSEQREDTERVRFNPEKHLMLPEAKKIFPKKSKLKTGDEIEIPLDTQADYGRIAAQTAKQVILQRIREAERRAILEEFKTKEGEIVSGIVQRIEGRNVFLDIGKTLGTLPKEEQVPGEFYRPGQRLKTYVLKVEETSKGPIIFLSRSYPKLVSRLFEMEVPEVNSGEIVIKSIAREAGSRSKIAVQSQAEGIDPIGSMVGQRGTRVLAVISELGGEKIDVMEYSETPEEFIANALAPVKVSEVRIKPKNKALAIVPEDQLSLAIGKDGQNVRLAAKLTGWKIDVRTPETAEEEIPEEEEKEKKVSPKKTKKKTTKKKKVTKKSTKKTKTT